MIEVQSTPAGTEDDLSTPALVIDEAVVERNLAKAAEYARGSGLKLRPHAKTHKSIAMARRQLAHGAVGLTVAKVGEAEVLAESGVEDLLVAYPVVDAARTNRLATLAHRLTVRVAVDSVFAAEALSAAAAAAGSTIGILADFDAGYGRTGVPTVAAVVGIARAADTLAGLRFDGLFYYPGHVLNRAADQAEPMGRAAAKVAEALERLGRAGLPAGIVSGGGTPTLYQSHLVPGTTEIRPGTYIYNDRNTMAGGWCAIEECAARIVCTVVSTSVAGKAVIDAGSKTLTSDRLSTNPDGGGFGHVVEFPDAKIVRLTEEHGELDITRCPKSPKLGQRVHVIPNHICPCVNLQDYVWLRRQDGGRYEPLRVDARGRLS